MSKPSVLVVEDDENIRMLYADALEAAGLEVSTAQNGKEGVGKALAEHPALILMDISMPEMDGHAAVEKIRLDSWGKKAKVVFLTNHSDPENVTNAVAAGSEDYIVKANTDIKEVVNKVRAAMHG